MTAFRLPSSCLAACAFSMPALAGGNVEPVDSYTDRQPLSTVVPEYPEAARRERIEGEVQVCFNISREGFPRRIAVRRSSHRYFEKPARDAIRRSTWKPLPRGEAVPTIKACRTFRFALVPVQRDEADAASAATRSPESGRN